MKSKKRPLQSRSRSTSMNPEERERELVSLATDLAEQQLRDGTASAQVITHYLKLGTKREVIEREILEKQRELIAAKTDNIKRGDNFEELITQAMQAFSIYSGQQ